MNGEPDRRARGARNDVRALVEGDVKKFVGFEFKRSQLCPFSSGSTTVRTIYAWQREYMVLGVGEEMVTTIDRLPMQSNAWQVYTAMLLDACRVEDEGIVQISCDESV